MKNKPKIDYEERLFQAALRCRDNGRITTSIKMLKKMLQRKRNCVSVYIVLGEIQWTHGKLIEAFHTFLAATKLEPKSIIASLGLFHVALELGKVDFALREGNRFLSKTPDCEYRRVVRNVSDVYKILHYKSKRVAELITPTGDKRSIKQNVTEKLVK